MTVKDVARRTGLTTAAIYKRIKAHGITLDAIKDKKTGHFTPEGERMIVDLFEIAEEAPETAEKAQETQVDNPLTTEVEKLKTENARLTTEVENLTKQVADLTGERDFLRRTLDTTTEALTNAQKLQAATLAKVPLLTSGEPGRLRRAWDKIRGKDRHE